MTKSSATPCAVRVVAKHKRSGIAFGNGTADLDYAAFSAFNKEQGMLLGIARLLFTDVDRTEVGEVHWRDQGSSKFSIQQVPLTLVPAPVVSLYRGPKGRKGQRVMRLIRERPRQVEFRRIFMPTETGVVCRIATSRRRWTGLT